MSLMQVWGVFLIFVLCPVLGALPLIEWVVRGLTGKRLSKLGTGNVSVSAAFYHGGRAAGILAVLSEAAKGIAAVLLARQFFPAGSLWEVVALMALVMGRYWGGRGAGTTNVVWGFLLHDPVAAGLVALIGGIGFTVLRDRTLGKLSVLLLMPILVALLHPYSGKRVAVTALLSLLLAWIYQKIPDDLDLSAEEAQEESKRVFQFFRGDRALLSLNQALSPEKVGSKAATLSALKRLGYAVPEGWVLPPGDDPAPLLTALSPSADTPLVVRSSAIGEDSDTASAAGQYESFLDITSPPALEQAILRCQGSYNLPRAVQYRQRQGSAEGGMAVLVQQQVAGAFSGVAFSRDPIQRQGEAVVIEALPGRADQVVSGRVTPESYRVWLPESPEDTPNPEAFLVEGTGDVPLTVIRRVALLTRQIEAHFHGVPQDVEWSYDGQQVWILQARPITTLVPIWTRKIAAEVIPGFIRPLTWSINRPLTCGVWGEIFTIVLGDRAEGLDFEETATLHHSAAYFNATLLGDIFRRMGLPPESLEFLTRGAKFSKPPLGSTLRNLPGLLRLVQRERRLLKEFAQCDRQQFAPALADLAAHPADSLNPADLLDRIDQILELLRPATYFNILAPLGFAARRALFRVDEAALDNRVMPEVAAVRSLQTLAQQVRSHLPAPPADPDVLLMQLGETPAGRDVLHQFDQFLDRYGYLSEVGTDIAVPTWREAPQAVQRQLAQFAQLAQLAPMPIASQSRPPAGKVRTLQQRLDLKGRVAEVYNRLLAELRWSFVALERCWLADGLLDAAGDIFFLEISEIRALVTEQDADWSSVKRRVQERRSRFEEDSQQTNIPLLAYGYEPPRPETQPERPALSRLIGIGASPGIAVGTVMVVRSPQDAPPLDRSYILVVPYTDAGWAPLLAQVGGLIAEVGGRLSHGAIVAREYQVPAVMNLASATQQLRSGQRVRLDGETGVVEVVEPE
ncbi:glycerol-3-phosphate acyltransferase [Thermoleptolyngbya sp. C42_A2020_037]|uniref:glycerol-3-phosphate acyltransferase n=1 Tax=Thermoleptolyngbya sp. C42_A2020_037 TaxID=2747799 RepID=UPI0019DA44AE|nr:glycerol-3-phosphate acyltransferase [Thermoleptolyngbya sp. C42_A2020_037]MBF2083703.1 glycerol-3-phosphate acyltransferase [Thermoleptolyngbya sp. C42_A2020_037]